jgi:hypothetical protein
MHENMILNVPHLRRNVIHTFVYQRIIFTLVGWQYSTHVLPTHVRNMIVYQFWGKLRLCCVCLPCTVSRTFSLADPFWLRKITTDTHIHAHVNIEYSDKSYQKLTISFSELILDGYEYIRNNSLHDFTLFKQIVAPFVGTGNFYISYPNGHTEYTLPIIKVP